MLVLGVLDGEPQAERRSDKTIFELRGTAAYVYAPSQGILETFHSLGAKVNAGEPGGQIHRVWEPGLVPRRSAITVTESYSHCRQPGRVKPGNCCLVVASPV